MEPLKFAFPASNWLLRVAVLLLVYMIFFGTFRSFSTSSIDFWIACGFGLFAILLFVGGFMKKHNLTLISAIMLTLGCGYKIFMYYVFSQGKLVSVFGVFAAITLYFATTGNRKK
jgi:hypothetical protein